MTRSTPLSAMMSMTLLIVWCRLTVTTFSDIMSPDY